MIRTPFNISILAELAITLAAASFVQADDALSPHISTISLHTPTKSQNAAQ
jgi:hypothetical protein